MLNIHINLFKVKSHTGNILNDQADILAKNGRNLSPISPILTGIGSRNLVALFNNIPIECSIWKFFKDFFSAHTFGNFLTLSRNESSRLLTLNSSIDWITIWKFLSLDSSSLVTSFTSTRLKTFIFKNLLDELPVLLRMVQLLPDLYKDWKCIGCNVDPETASHIWRCSAYISKITTIVLSARNLLDQLLEVYSFSPSLSSEIDSIFNQTFDIFSDTGLIYIMKSLIPCSLVSVIHKATRSRNKAIKIITQLLLFFFQKMYEDVWKPRCKFMIAKEKHLGITSKDKRLRSVSKFMVHNNNYHAPNMWET